MAWLQTGRQYAPCSVFWGRGRPITCSRKLPAFSLLDREGTRPRTPHLTKGLPSPLR
jgi:hypothetical protein